MGVANIDALQKDVFEDLSNEINPQNDRDKVLLLQKVKNAVREVQRTRDYHESYQHEQIANDLERYYSNIRGLAIYDYNQIGAEGQVSHSESGESRSWADRLECLNGVVAVARVI